jgi:hypothetical protein
VPPDQEAKEVEAEAVNIQVGDRQQEEQAE